jgi:hypothetical protein
VKAVTKKDYIKNSMFYTGEGNVKNCIKYLEETLHRVTKNTIKFEESVFIEPSAGSGSFSTELSKNHGDISVFSMDIYPRFDGCKTGNFLDVKRLKDTGLDYTIVIGFPPVRQYEDFVKHSMFLGADVIAFIMPVSSINKKNLKTYSENEYTVVFSNPINTKDFKLADESSWDFSGNFVILVKNQYIEGINIEKKEEKTYKDFFEIYTINSGVLTIKETTQPNLFRNNRVPKNRKTGKPYDILKDSDGNRYYYQNGINMDKIEECQLFLPLRVFPSKQEGMILYETFYDDTFAKIGFGLKIRDGYTIKKVKGKIIYYIYREMYKGIYTLVAKLDDDAVKNFYARQRYNNGVYVSSKKLIEANKKGII